MRSENEMADIDLRDMHERIYGAIDSYIKCKYGIHDVLLFLACECRIESMEYVFTLSLRRLLEVRCFMTAHDMIDDPLNTTLDAICLFKTSIDKLAQESIMTRGISEDKNNLLAGSTNKENGGLL